MKFNDKGDFKILQSKLPESPQCHKAYQKLTRSVADLHYSVGKGKCIDTELEPCDGDAETAKWLGEALDAEKPDMVVSLLFLRHALKAEM